VGRSAEPAQIPAQGSEGGAADAVEVGRVHGQGFEPLGLAAGGADRALGGQGAQFLQQLGPARGQALAQVGKHPLTRHPIEHQPATGRQEGESLRQLLLQLAATAAEQGAVAQVEAEAAVISSALKQRMAAAPRQGRPPGGRMARSLTRCEDRPRDAVGVRRPSGQPLPKWWPQNLLGCF